MFVAFLIVNKTEKQKRIELAIIKGRGKSFH